MDRITSSIIDCFIKEIKKKDNMEKMRSELIDPIIHHTFKRLYPYIIVVSIVFISTFILRPFNSYRNLTTFNKR